MKSKNPQQNLKDKTDVLIALASQKSKPVGQPPSPEELVNFFENSKRFSKKRQGELLAYLDSNPQAYERWIRHNRQTAKSTRALSPFLILPYAIAVCTAFLILGTLLLWPEQTFELDQAIDRAYQAAVISDDPEALLHTMTALTDSLQQTKNPLSFSQPGQLSLSAQAFTLGLKHNWEATDKQPDNNDPLTDAQQKDYQLGRWYTVLWAVAQQHKIMPVDFWKAQINILDHLKTHYTQHAQEVNTTEIEAVIIQLEHMQTTLQSLTENNQDAKLYRQLEQALNALRYSLIPSL